MSKDGEKLLKTILKLVTLKTLTNYCLNILKLYFALQFTSLY